MGKFWLSFVNGFAGLAHAVATEQNLRIHLAAAAGVIATGIYFALAAWEWAAVSLCLGLVISAECMNTALERLADRVSLAEHPLIKQAKDCSSAAVLVLALISVVVGGIVFGPKVWVWMGW